MIIISAMGRARTETALLPKTALFPPLVYSSVLSAFYKGKYWTPILHTVYCGSKVGGTVYSSSSRNFSCEQLQISDVSHYPRTVHIIFQFNDVVI